MPTTAEPDTRRGLRRDLRVPVARAVWLMVALLGAAGVIRWALLGFRELPVSEAGSVGTVVGCVILSLTYATVGLLLAERRPGNVIAWLFLAAAIGLGTVLPGSILVADAHAVLRPVPRTTLLVAWWVSTVTLPAYIALMTATVLMFPSGRPIGRRWWAVLVAAVAGAVLMSASAALEPSGLPWYPSLANPIGAVAGAARPALGAVGVLGAAVALVAMLGAIVSIGRRRRGADATMCRQLHWVGMAAIVTTLAALPAMAARYAQITSPATTSLLTLVAVAGQVAVPIGVGIAILRHHLYDIELVVDRSLVYLPLMGLLGGLYAGSVALVQRVFVTMTGDTSDIAIVVSSLLIAWVFTPLRRLLEGLVDRHLRLPREARLAGQPASVSTSELEAEIRTLEARMAVVEAASIVAGAASGRGRPTAQPGSAAGSSRRSRMPRYAFQGPTSAS